jgi:hypothetical protein
MSEGTLAIIATTFVTAIAAFAIWATVRLINKRKQPRSFWAAVIAVQLLVLYPLCFLPACWLSSRLQPSGRVLSAIYSPLISAIGTSQDTIRIPMTHQIWMGCPKGTVITGRMREGRLAFLLRGTAPTPNLEAPAQSH